MEYRTEHDSMGEINVPADKYWGAQTQRSFENFRIGVEKMPLEIVRAIAMIKKACAAANVSFGKLSPEKADYISAACDEIVSGVLDAHFPLSVWQTGSGTQTNMNVNEVIANRGNELAGKKLLHPNDDVNMSQSSNDVFPAAIHVASYIAIERRLLPAAHRLIRTLERLEKRYYNVIKIGRTHLMDATPVTFGQEISGWRMMLVNAVDMTETAMERLLSIPLGGTAVGTGLNSPDGFGKKACAELSGITFSEFKESENKFASLTSKDAVVFVHGALTALASDLWKIANDVRLLASGPRCGVGEITIPSNEPGSSIMPGKVNPTQCEAVTMVALQVQAHNTALAFAASQGNFELNVFMPVIAFDMMRSVDLLTGVIDSFNNNCVKGIKPNESKMRENLDRSLMLVTALSPKIGYEEAAKVAKYAYENGLTLKEACLALGVLDEPTFDSLIRPERMV